MSIAADGTAGGAIEEFLRKAYDGKTVAGLIRDKFLRARQELGG